MVTVPITHIDEPTSTIEFGFNPGFTNGEALTYIPLEGQGIGGLSTTGTATYDAIVNSASPNTLQLAATSSPGSPLPLNLNPQFSGFRQSVPVTFNPGGFPANSIQFHFNTGFQTTSHFVYQGSGISELKDGVTYWVIPNASNPTVIQLALTQGGTPITFTETGSKTFTFDPSVSINGNDNTVALGFNYALAGTLPTGTPLVYHGALDFNVQGLTSGTTYYVIQDPANPQIMRSDPTDHGPAEQQRQLCPGGLLRGGDGFNRKRGGGHLLPGERQLVDQPGQ